MISREPAADVTHASSRAAEAQAVDMVTGGRPSGFAKGRVGMEIVAWRRRPSLRAHASRSISTA